MDVRAWVSCSAGISTLGVLGGILLAIGVPLVVEVVVEKLLVEKMTALTTIRKVASPVAYTWVVWTLDARVT
jgi:hypothetical protein